MSRGRFETCEIRESETGLPEVRCDMNAPKTRVASVDFRPARQKTRGPGSLYVQTRCHDSAENEKRGMEMRKKLRGVNPLTVRLVIAAVVLGSSYAVRVARAAGDCWQCVSFGAGTQCRTDQTVGGEYSSCAPHGYWSCWVTTSPECPGRGEEFGEAGGEVDAVPVY